MDLSYSSTAMNFTENQQGSAVLERLRQQKDADRFCDVIFHVQDKQYLAHRCVIAACSPYFDSMLRANHIGKELLKITCDNCDVFEILLNYMYTGKVVIDGTSVTDMLKLANHFVMSKLKEHCCEYMERNLNITNCFSIKEQAQKCGTAALAQTVEHFIASNIHEIVKQYEITEFSQNELEILFNMNYNLSEDQKFWIVVRWIRCNVADREPAFKPLLGCIAWSRTTLPLIYEALKSDDLFTLSEKCFFQLLQILEDNRMLLEQYFDTYAELKNKLSVEQSMATDDMMQLAMCTALDLHNNMVDQKPGEEQPQEAGRPGEDAIISQTMVEEEGMASFNDSILPSDPADVDPQKPQISNVHSPSSSAKNHGKHKRKGIPVKVKVPKLDASLQAFPRRRRGRPPKKYYSDQVKNVRNLDAHKSESAPDDNDFPNDLIIDENFDGEAKDNVQSLDGNKRGRKRVERIKCIKCFYVASSGSRMNQHMRTAHKDDTTFYCQMCDFKCKWNREYYRHMKQHFTGLPYKCDFEDCDYTSERIQPLLYHRMVHTDERPFECTVCNTKFRTKNNLTTHLRCHTGVKPYKCEVCGKCFATKGTLEQHTVTHSDVRPYLCDTCGFTTKYQSHLIAHKRIHSGDVYKCHFDNCDYTTPKRSQLSAHMRIHLSIRSHVCRVCGRSFVEKSHLVRHERIHLDDKPFKCDQCDYGSTRRDKLKEHKEKHHGSNASSKSPYRPRKPRKQTPPQPVLPTDQALVDNVGVDADFMKDQTLNLSSQQDSNSLQMMTSSIDRSFGLMLPNVMPNVQLTSVATTMDTNTSTPLESRFIQTLTSVAMAGSLGLDGRGSLTSLALDSRVASNSRQGIEQTALLDMRGQSVQTAHLDLRTHHSIEQLAGLDERAGLASDPLQLTSQSLHSSLVDQSAGQTSLALQHSDSQQQADLTNLSAFMGMF